MALYAQHRRRSSREHGHRLCRIQSASIFPGIRYAGRLATDPPNDLSQGEATMFTGAGSQTDTNGRWGDYSMTTVDPSDGMSFWHVNEYYATNSSFNWHTRIGKFNFQGGGQSPTPTLPLHRLLLQLGGWTEPAKCRSPLGWRLFPS